MYQKKYALEVISYMGLAGAKPMGAPVELNQKLIFAEFDKHLGLKDDALLEDPGSYQRLNGTLLYLIVTSPGVLYAV